MPKSHIAYSNCLTNEKLYSNRKQSQFDIINTAIDIATAKVISGNDSLLVDNVAFDTLAELADEREGR